MERKKLKKDRKEEKKILKIEKKLNKPKWYSSNLVQKLLLRESWGNFNLTRVVVAGDLIVIITHIMNVSMNFKSLLK